MGFPTQFVLGPKVPACEGQATEIPAVVQQISAAGRALDQTGFKILASVLHPCLQDEPAAEHAGHSQDEVLALVAPGRTNRQIGQALFITLKTASVHVSRILASWGSPVAGRQPRSPTVLGLDKQCPSVGRSLFSSPWSVVHVW